MAITLTNEERARIAVMRFGLGPKPDGYKKLVLTPNAALEACLQELDNPAMHMIYDPSLAPTVTGGRFSIDLSNGTTPLNQYVKKERTAYWLKVLEPEVGFVERLVLFWANHFSIHARKNMQIEASINHFERSVIRRNVLGKFSDMLKAAIKHPAMLHFLDNANSTGPRSTRGQNLNMSLNENLAREVMELHTLGVYGGYTQADVTNMSRVLTGWQPDGADLFTMRFESERHEPGIITVMGKSFGPLNQARGEAALDMLAHHPSTARHIAFKLLRYFVADTPSRRSVAALASVFLKTGGDLKAVARALLLTRGAWTQPVNRLRPPLIWHISLVRAANFNATFGIDYNQTDTNNFHRYSANLGQMRQGCQTPNGYPDDSAPWENPNLMRLYSHEACSFSSTWITSAKANRRVPKIRASQYARRLFGSSVISTESIAAMDAVGDGPDYAILFMSPEFLLR
jgi:uncharacterized protein (DUF1800 family)